MKQSNMLILLFFFASVFAEGESSDDCGYYMAPSFIPGAARGIFAGKNYKENDLVEYTPSLLVTNDHIRDFQLFNYVYGANDDEYSIAVFGAAMLFNHRNPKSVTHYWHGPVVENTDITFNIFSNAHTSYTELDYYSTITTEAGQELFASYGDGDEW